MRRIAIVIALSMTAITVGCDSNTDDDPEMPDRYATLEVGTPDDESEESHDHDHDDESELVVDLEPGETRHFGEPFAIDDEPIQLVDALKTLDGLDEGESSPALKIEARVELVCKKKGCWFTLDDDAVDQTVRVRMKDYGFFVPRNTDGATTIIEGTVKETVIDEELARHYAEDVAEHTGEDPEQIEGDQKTYRFTATGLSMHQPES